MTINPRRIKFLKDFDYSPTPQITISYKAGMVMLVRLECAQKAIGEGKAEYVLTPDMPPSLKKTVE